MTALPSRLSRPFCGGRTALAGCDTRSHTEEELAGRLPYQDSISAVTRPVVADHTLKKHRQNSLPS